MAIPKLAPASTASGDYTKIQEGENKLRIVSEVIAGWEYWRADNTPVRSFDEPKGRPADCRPASGDFDNLPRVVWACAVYNYDTKKVELWVFGQKGITDGLTKLEEDGEWGDTQKYGIKVYKNNVKGKTTYSVMPGKEAPLTADVQAAVDAKPIDLQAVFQNSNPFDTQPKPGAAATPEQARQLAPVDDSDLPF